MQEVFSKYLDYLEVERNASPFTIRNYTNDLLGNYQRGPEKGFFQYLKYKNISSLKEVDKHTLRDYIAWLMEQGVVKTSIARKLSAIRSFFRYLVREEMLPSNPLEKASSPKLDKRLPEFLTVDEMKRLLAAPASATPQGQRDRAFLELLYASGLRVSELVGLRLSNLFREEEFIRVIGKGDKERLVPVSRKALKEIDLYLPDRNSLVIQPGNEDLLFLNRRGRMLTRVMVFTIIKELASAAGIKKSVSPHTFRHSFATHLVEGGSQLLAHALALRQQPGSLYLQSLALADSCRRI